MWPANHIMLSLNICNIRIFLHYSFTASYFFNFIFCDCIFLRFLRRKQKKLTCHYGGQESHVISVKQRYSHHLVLIVLLLSVFSELFITWTDWKHLWTTWTRGRPEQRMMGQIVHTHKQLISQTVPESRSNYESEIKDWYYPTDTETLHGSYLLKVSIPASRYLFFMKTSWKRKSVNKWSSKVVSKGTCFY